jgi:hypothetical protein
MMKNNTIAMHRVESWKRVRGSFTLEVIIPLVCRGGLRHKSEISLNIGDSSDDEDDGGGGASMRLLPMPERVWMV